jgi:hypothetical protein
MLSLGVHICTLLEDGPQTCREEVRIKIHHYFNLYLNQRVFQTQVYSTFLPLEADTSGRLYDDFIHLLFLHAHRETSAWANKLPKESDQFRFLHSACLVNLKGSVSLILEKASVMRISVVSFIRSRHPTPLLVPSLVLFPR